MEQNKTLNGTQCVRRGRKQEVLTVGCRVSVDHVTRWSLVTHPHSWGSSHRKYLFKLHHQINRSYRKTIKPRALVWVCGRTLGEGQQAHSEAEILQHVSRSGQWNSPALSHGTSASSPVSLGSDWTTLLRGRVRMSSSWFFFSHVPVCMLQVYPWGQQCSWSAQQTAWRGQRRIFDLIRAFHNVWSISTVNSVGSQSALWKGCKFDLNHNVKI